MLFPSGRSDELARFDVQRVRELSNGAEAGIFAATLEPNDRDP